MPAHPATFCKIAIGDITVTFVPDGAITSNPLGSFPGSSEALWGENPQFLDDAGFLVMSLGALLIETSGKLALIDLGWGPGTVTLGDGSPNSSADRISGGALLDNLAKVGVRPKDVDAVFFSHLHRDHTGWIVDPHATGSETGTPAFPDAEHYLSEKEWSYWTSPGTASVGPAPSQEQVSVLSQRIAFLSDGEAPLPGINAMATPGHTPGHLSFVISSGSERAVVLGDAVHCPIEILEPELTFVVDVDPGLAQRSRAHIEQELLAPGTLAAAAHFPDLVFGRLMPGQGKSSWHFPSSQAMTP